MAENYNWIEHPNELEPLLMEVVRHQTVVIDTEADSMHHYREKLCLIQLSLGETHWIVDPLAGLDLEPLMKLLEDRELLIHGADYDLRLLYRTFQFRPTNVFDTVLAAQLLGRAHFGLAALVEEVCGVVLPKEGQRADWSQRPLTEKLLQYAADDTRYLARVAAVLRAELEEKGRLEWHRESCERQMTATREPRRVSEEEAWRVKGGKHLTGRSAAVLRELWQWREEHARQSDRPPFKIAGTELLLKYAQWAAENPNAEMEQAPERPEWLRGTRLRTFESALGRSLYLPRAQWPGPPQTQGVSRFSREEETVLRQLIKARDAVAAQLELDPGVLGPREALRAIVRQQPRTVAELAEHSPLMKWQTECLAEPLIEALHAPVVDAGAEATAGATAGAAAGINQGNLLDNSPKSGPAGE